jgi:hypothetical protein
VLCHAGCGGGETATARLESPAVCSSAWHSFLAPQPFDITSSLVSAGATLYYSSLNAKALLAIATDGSAPVTLASVVPSEVWTESDHLLFTGGDLNNQIYSLPLAGGTPQLVLDGGAGRTTPGLAMTHAFTASDFYWVEEASIDGAVNPSTVWHQARSGDSPAQIGVTTFTQPGGLSFPGTAIALSGDTVLVGSAFGQAAAIPVGGGALAALAAPNASADLNVQSDLAGIDALGAYWAVPGVGDQPASLMLSPADGSPAKAFWPALPVSTEPVKICPVLEGGWVVVSLQVFDDGLSHTTITLLDAQGNATRLACSPGEGSNSWIEKGVAVTPDAVYVPAENLSADTWQIDRIAR